MWPANTFFFLSWFGPRAQNIAHHWFRAKWTLLKQYNWAQLSEQKVYTQTTVEKFTKIEYTYF